MTYLNKKNSFSVNILRRSGEGEKMIKLGLVFHRIKSPGGAAGLPNRLSLTLLPGKSAVLKAYETTNLPVFGKLKFTLNCFFIS